MRDAQDLRRVGVVENVAEWWSADQKATKVKKKMKAKEDTEVRAAKRSAGALRGASRRRVRARAARSQTRERTEEAIAAAQARGVKICPAKSDIFLNSAILYLFYILRTKSWELVNTLHL